MEQIFTGYLLHIQRIPYNIILEWKKARSISLLSGAEHERYYTHVPLLERDEKMNWQEAERLAERIRAEAPKMIVVLGIEPLGPTRNPAYASAFFVKCACKMTGFPFVVKSFEHWEDLKQHVIVRICRAVYRLLMKSGIGGLNNEEQRIKG